MYKPLVLLGLAVLLASLLVGCSSSATDAGTARVYLTDQPASPYRAVTVTTKRIDLVTEEGSVATVFNGTQQVDLLTLDNVQTLLSTATVPEGTYCQIRLVLSTTPGDNFVTLASDSSTQNLLLSSQGRTGLKLVGQIVITADQTTNILLDFDASRSIVEQGNGELRLKPVVQLVCESDETADDACDDTPLGEIEGELAPVGALATAQIAAIDTATEVVAAQGTIKQCPEDGRFLPEFELDVPPGTYQLVVTATGYQTYDSGALSPAVTYTVTADQTVDAGTITLTPAP